ncbi:MAG: 3-methyl-2-oxobutanoate hydroxymethyltransferase [Victivallaceae bacterium]|jgi:3-methyl-2-oxobutanoate hydroxymethyltransferase|nr:3-methyl-2-oxobutanoate hydroxymethyltransferase [Victivallaceae bacterium]MDD3117118.1 3-methyl-2-oxobutanoate hydroxymethyltransferase [Victivallaceae bacterium]MDD3703955.1 3-methyl-2-oxobutanoate hydroxymethyltransferase [Victivallaceae bacterium]MDD4317850.1 3-methyl-2-oxobutanoate hydroxymethyltransferase [Victivallaceae bacterium]MDD5663548.1 3-methyl-2-oxobutanoate hydroxymethyltransferase [Victivallaceae bacterium]
MAGKINVGTFRKMKERGEPIVMLTAYDSLTAAMAAAAGIEIILVGDSMANTVLGYENTIPLTLEQSLHHCAAVRRGAPNAFIVGDMPFMSYEADITTGLNNAARYLKEAGCNAIKIEGGLATVPLIEKMIECGIPVMGHIGLMPHRVMVSGGYKLAGKTESETLELIETARRLESAGIFSLVLEGIPALSSQRIAESVKIPTIGIGAGVHCDGQVQVITDLLGMSDGFLPRHAKQYVKLHEIIGKAFRQYVDEVKNKTFPGDENSF